MTEKRLKFLEAKIAYRLARSKASVFMREDFDDLAGYDQIGRVLRQMVAKGELIKIGSGLYTRTTISPLSGKTIPQKSLPELTAEVLERLNVERQPSSFERAYNEGRTTQVPTGRVIAIKGRIARKIGYDGKYVTFERASA
jgi:hypothetical protein